jgi:hypothetical protein
MKRIVADWLILFALSVGSSTCLVAQSLPADRFLDGVSAHPVGDEAERSQSEQISQSLTIASPSEVKRVLPSILQHTRSSNEVHVRGYATLFLLEIAIRLDGADLLSSNSEENSSLIGDANPGIQKGAVAITDYVIARPATNKQPYLSALKTTLQRPQTSQDVCSYGNDWASISLWLQRPGCFEVRAGIPESR